MCVRGIVVASDSESESVFGKKSSHKKCYFAHNIRLIINRSNPSTEFQPHIIFFFPSINATVLKKCVSSKYQCHYPPRIHISLFRPPFPSLTATTSSSSPCSNFNSQLYRPALCSTCFHTVAAHFSPGEWVEESDGSRVYFRSITTNECLFARPGGAELNDIIARVRAAAAAAALSLSAQENHSSGINVADQAGLIDARTLASSVTSPPSRRIRIRTPTTSAATHGDQLENDDDEGEGEDEDEDEDEDDDGSILPPVSMSFAASATPRTPPQIPPPEQQTPLVSMTTQDSIPLSLPVSMPKPFLQPPPSSKPPQSQAQSSTPLAPPPLLQAQLPSPLESTPLSPFFELLPHNTNPLLVDVRALASVNGVLVQRVRQAYDETYGAERTLIVTPTTIMAVAPHPTRLGIGVLKWERSLLSIQNLVTQPLLRTMSPRGAGGGASSAVLETNKNSTTRLPAALLEEDSITLAAGEDLLVVDQLPYDVAIATSPLPPPSPPQKGKGGLLNALKGWARGTGTNQATPTLPASQRGFIIYGVGVLLSFAPERSASMPLLRTVRGGLTAVSREGSLLKRKRSEWREHANLGPLAWKRRLVRLEGTSLSYFASGKLKGVIVLDGWVEVARAGADVSGGVRSGAITHDDTARTGAFVLRTAKTCHVFQAASPAEADAWVEAISVVAQHAAAGAHAPVCVVTRGHVEAAAIAEAIIERRDALIARASTAAAARDKCVPLSSADAAALAAVEAWADAQAISVDLEASASLAGVAQSVSRQERAPPGGGAGAIAGEKNNTLSLTDALALADALGGVTGELLAQLPRSLGVALCAARGLPPPGLALSPPSTTLTYQTPPTARETYWFYNDPSGHMRGPSPSSLCAAWTAAGFFDLRTTVRASEPLVEGSPAAIAVRAAAALAGPTFASAWISPDGLTPIAYLPIGTLFGTTSVAFSSSASWPVRYANEMAWAALPVWALSAGVSDPVSVIAAVAGMRTSGAPPDPGLLLDVLGA